MPYMVLLHISGEEAIAAEMEELPKSNDNVVTVTNPRKKDGKELHNIDSRAVKVVYPISRLTFIEVLGSEESDQIISFVRE